MPPSSPNVPCRVEKTTCCAASTPAGISAALISKRRVGNDRAKASAEARPEPRETSRSADVPPANTAMIGRGIINGGEARKEDDARKAAAERRLPSLGFLPRLPG